MKILALDASTHSTGYAIGENDQLISYGCVAAISKNAIERIIKMRDQLSKIIKNQNIDKIIIEEVRPEYNSYTNKILMWLQAAIMVAAHEANPAIEYEFIIPSSWRAKIGIKQGRGIKRDVLKQRDINYVKEKYNLDVNDDQADAICIFDAYCKEDDNEINWE